MEGAEGSRVRAVTFDAVETIIHDRFYPPDRYFAALCRLADIHLSEEAALEGARARKRFQEAAKSTTATTDWYRARHAAGLRGAGVEGDLEPVIDRIRQGMPTLVQRWVVDPDIPTVFEALQQRGVLLAVISNFDRTLADTLVSLGIAHHFRVITASAVVGISKPDPRLVTLTCAQLGVDPQECLHVGDSPGNDAAMAAAAGAQAVIYDPIDCLEVQGPRVSRLMDVLRLL